MPGYLYTINIKAIRGHLISNTSTIIQDTGKVGLNLANSYCSLTNFSWPAYPWSCWNRSLQACRSSGTKGIIGAAMECQGETN